MNINDFIENLKKINININVSQLKQLEKYYELLIEYNEKMNLTGITEKEQVYLKHFYDSLTINKIIDLNTVENLCDVGTGAGFPGLVIKILFPKINVTLVDSLNKRIDFLNAVIKELNLVGIDTLHDRIENFGRKTREKYDVVTARAVSSLNILLEYCLPLVKYGKYFIPLKANISREILEIDHAKKELNCELVDKLEFLLPSENSTRTILKFKKLKATPKKYPRPYSRIKKKPL
ncbi:MAG: 16S rRNA (guanine(527)-N(7))-methyltransferase RsmG [Bacilli bacterium]|nr:16S rRNA (guanine(527)-N(7))-methyltransferase RsmG [Bacilli bacterium]